MNHLWNSIVATASAAITAIIPVLAVADERQVNEEMRVLLIPFASAVLISGAMMMLNPQPETKRIIMGRCCFSLLGGTIGPTILSLWIPMFAGISQHPVILLGMGGFITMLLYALSRPFTRQLYLRSEGLAQRQLDLLEDRYFEGASRMEENTRASKVQTASIEANNELLAKRVEQEETHSRS